MTTEQIIKELKNSNLYAECPEGFEFKLSNALLFDGTKPFPELAAKTQEAYISQLKNLKEELKKRKFFATTKSEVTARAVNLGKMLEKILPTMQDFHWKLSETRFMGEPIDLLVFNGLSKNKVTSIDFVEVKSGGAVLNQHQKQIRDAIQDKKVLYKVFE